MYAENEEVEHTTILSSIAALALPVRTVENAPVVLSMLFSILVICPGERHVKVASTYQ